MNKFVRSIVNFYFPLEKEKRSINNEIYIENSKRIIYLALLAIPVSLIHVIFFGYKLRDSVGIEYDWRLSIFLSHSFIVIFLSYVSIRLIFQKRTTPRAAFVHKFYTYVMMLALLIMGSVITSADQLVTVAINPFIIATIVTGLIFLIPPILSTIYFVISFIIFFIAISYTQPNQEVLISSIVNGITVTAIGMVLSYILWQGNYTRSIQRRLILKQNLELKELNAEKDKFFSVLAHDLKSPFASIIGFSEIMEEDINEKKYDNLGFFAETIRITSKNTYTLLENLFEWSLSQSGKISVQILKTKILDIIDMVKTDVETIAISKNINISFQSEKNFWVMADKNMLRTVLRNLLVNAIKFSFPHNQIIVSIKEKQNSIEISVQDFGVGMSERIKDQLFKLSGNISTPGTSNEIGSGYGLLICKEFLEKQEGRIEVESEENVGSIFTITIPKA